MKEPTKDILLGLALLAVMVALALFAISGCRVAEKADIAAIQSKTSTEIRAVNATVNDAKYLALVVVASQAGLVTVFVFLDSRAWQKKIESLRHIND